MTFYSSVDHFLYELFILQAMLNEIANVSLDLFRPGGEIGLREEIDECRIYCWLLISEYRLQTFLCLRFL